MPNPDESPRQSIADPYLGKVLDKYTLVEKLGTGGMGLVYRAEQVRIKREVAIKLLSARLVSDAINVKRIEREANSMGKLRHPNIATFHDFGISPEGQPYLVMEFISGKSLGQLLDEEKRVEPRRLIAIMAQVADAMAYAHKREIIHRDLKPDNIMLSCEHKEDFVKVLDFGIAKSADENLALTQSGVLIGSPLYMSPEQCKGEKLDAKTDIYSLGVIMYEALTGIVPCKGATIYETIGRKTQEQPPPFPPELGGWKLLERLTLACLATNPDHRPESMGVVHERLSTLLSTPAAVSQQAQVVESSAPVSTTTSTSLHSPTRTTGDVVAAASAEATRRIFSMSKKNLILLGVSVLVIYLVGITGAFFLIQLLQKNSTGSVAPTPAPTAAVTTAPQPSSQIPATRTIPPVPSTPPVAATPASVPTKPALNQRGKAPVVKVVRAKPKPKPSKKPVKPAWVNTNDTNADTASGYRPRYGSSPYLRTNPEPYNTPYTPPVRSYEPQQQRRRPPDQSYTATYFPERNSRKHNRDVRNERELESMIQRRNQGGDVDMQRLQNLQRRVTRGHGRRQGQSVPNSFYGGRSYYGN